MNPFEQRQEQKRQYRDRDIEAVLSGEIDSKSLSERNFFLKGLSGSDLIKARKSRNQFEIFA